MNGPHIHWFAFDCGHHTHGDSFTNAPVLVTCGICKRHVEFILPRLSRVIKQIITTDLEEYFEEQLEAEIKGTATETPRGILDNTNRK